MKSKRSNKTTDKVDVAIIGAGPYGLSLAAHLNAKGLQVSIYGKAMGTWREQMPSGMYLKSEGFACNLYDPDGELTLKTFCSLNGIDYADIGIPVKLDTFTAYGLEFQRRFVPFLDEQLVTSVDSHAAGFRVELESGKRVVAHCVVIAAGISHFRYLPPILAQLPQGFVSHSSQHHSFERFRGRDVVVVGAGSSAIDVAVSLYEAGAKPQVITRRPSIPFHGRAPLNRPLLTRVKAPWSGLGPSWRSRLACDLPLMFHAMPKNFRSKVVRKHLGPAAGWFTRKTIEANVVTHLGSSLVGAEVEGTKVCMRLADTNGEQRQVVADHVIAGTGYQMDIKRLKFLNDAILNTLCVEEASPSLSRNFESSIAGLYFIGTSAALSFGPLLRFTFGARFVSPHLSKHLVRKIRKLDGAQYP